MRAYVDINLKNLEYNILKLKKIAGEKDILAVLKADAYGLGAIKVAKKLENIGINFIGVATLNEAIELQEAGIKSNILILSTIFIDEFEEATKRGIHINVTSIEQLKYIKDNNLKPIIHMKIDTGMTRLGFDIDTAKKAFKFCKQHSIEIAGIFSHLSDADTDSISSKEFTLEQIRKFKNLIDESELSFRYTHISNTAGLLYCPNEIIDNMVRVGIGMYGYAGNKKIKILKNVFTLKSRILFTKSIKENSYVSYGRTYELLPNENYAVISIGYADGIRKYLSKGGYVLINGEKCEIIGKICMDLLTVKIPEKIIGTFKLGDEVIIINSDIIDELNIPELCVWELMTGMGKRVFRIYIE